MPIAVDIVSLEYVSEVLGDGLDQTLKVHVKEHATGDLDYGEARDLTDQTFTDLLQVIADNAGWDIT